MRDLGILFFTAAVEFSLFSWTKGVNNYNVAVVAKGRPQVDCLPDRMKLTVDMVKGTPSEIFVKGRHHSGGNCVAKNTQMFTIKHDECGLEPERSLNPPGLYFRSCLIVKLHPFFVTMVDKTYCISCFYMEAVKNIDPIDIGVSMLPQTEVGVSFPMPVCSHSIRRGSPTGPVIRYATVGEPIFHVWSCPSEQYGMLVQNCFVSDDEGTRIQIINNEGCGIDKYIIETPLYNQDLTLAYRESCVFKFADKPVTRFNCQIKVCIKPGGGCEGVTPPANCLDYTSGNNPSPFPRPGNRPFPFSNPSVAVEAAPTMVQPEYRYRDRNRHWSHHYQQMRKGRYSRNVHSNQSSEDSKLIIFPEKSSLDPNPMSSESKNVSKSPSKIEETSDQNETDVGKTMQGKESENSDDSLMIDDGFDYVDVKSEIFVLEAPESEAERLEDLEKTSILETLASAKRVCVPSHIFTLILITLPIFVASHATLTLSLLLRIRYYRNKTNK